MSTHAADLVLVLHNHQPYGNFGSVFETAYNQCYRPTLDLLAQYPKVKWGLHHTGPLLEWLADNRPEYLRDVKTLVQRGQVELLGGGFHEPMLAVLPDRDAQGQIEMMAAFCEGKLGAAPKGMWLAERVWEPDLPRVIAPTGMRYTLLDDTHLQGAGVMPPPGGELSGYYVTEKTGHPLAVFPIAKALRYAIPFQEAERALDSIVQAAHKSRRPGAPPPVLTYGDDGEKFGVWPGTHEWVFGKQWLKKFLAGLSQDERLRTRLPGQVIEEDAPQGRVYIPTASYAEMGEWSLPALASRQFADLRRAAESKEAPEAVRSAAPFLRGGIWQGFLSKYPESNWIHKRMLYVSGKLGDVVKARNAGTLDDLGPTTDDRIATAQRLLYAGQCNCAYWHGLFGGIYLNYLRHSLLEALIKCENILDTILDGKSPPPVRMVEADLDADLSPELLLSNKLVNVIIAPAQGGGMFTFDHRPKAFALQDVLARRPEAYHVKLKDALTDAELKARQGQGIRSPHDVVKAKEPGLQRYLKYDTAPRASFLDRFYAAGVIAQEIAEERVPDAGTFVHARYRVMEKNRSTIPGGPPTAEVALAASGTVGNDEQTQRVVVEKRFLLSSDAAALQVTWSIANASDHKLSCVFAPELNLTLLAANAEDRFYEAEGLQGRPRLGTTGVTEGGELCMVDGYYKLRVVMSAEGAQQVARYPVETVNQSEDGFERCYQGSCLQPVFVLNVEPGKAAVVSVLLGIEEL